VLGRRLDRYVTSFFLWHFVLVLVAVFGLYIVVETFTELDEFIKGGDPWATVRLMARYHFYHIPVLFSQFLPIVTLLAGIIALARLSSYNELNAMKAAGVSMYRTLVPVFACTLAIGALAMANQELLLPRLENRIGEVEFERRGGNVSTRLWVYDEATRTSLEAEKLDTTIEGKELRRIEAVADPDTGPDGRPLPPARVQAAKALWADQWLFLLDGHVTDSRGQQHPFHCRILRAPIPAAAFHPEGRPTGCLSDGTPAYLLRVRTDLPALHFVPPDTKTTPAELPADPLGPRDLNLQFASVDLLSRYRLIFGGYLAGSYAGEQTLPPLSIPVALWHEKHWIGRAQTYTEMAADSPQAQRRLIVYDGQPLPIQISPALLARKRVDPSLKSARYLLRRVQDDPTNARLRQRIGVLLHGRLAFPLANFVLLLLAIPLLFQHEGGKSTWIGVGLALVVSLVFYFFSYFCQFIGQDPHGVFGGLPAVAAWLPIAVFGAGGAILTANMNT
jgi:lipopolysaccharide export LptBFGC system permease protein LptF